MLPLSRNSCRTRGRKAGAASTEHGSTRPCPPPMCLELARKRLQKADKSSVGLVYRESHPDLEPILLLEIHDGLLPMLCKKRGGQPFASGAAWRVRGPGWPARKCCTQVPVV